LEGDAIATADDGGQLETELELVREGGQRADAHPFQSRFVFRDQVQDGGFQLLEAGGELAINLADVRKSVIVKMRNGPLAGIEHTPKVIGDALGSAVFDRDGAYGRAIGVLVRQLFEQALRKVTTGARHAGKGNKCPGPASASGNR